MWVLWIIGVLLGGICFLLVSPLFILIDSRHDVYGLRWWGIGRVAVVFDDRYVFGIRARIFFLKKTFFPFRPRVGKSKPEKPVTRKAVPRRPSAMGRRMVNVLRSFHVNAFRLDVDTGNPVTNAWLHPLFYFLQRKGLRVAVNYTGNNRVVFMARNRLVNMIYSFMSNP